MLILATIVLSQGRISLTGKAVANENFDSGEYIEPTGNFYLILVIGGIILLVMWYYFNTIKKEFNGRAN